jgi:cyanophycin synthetase
MNVSRIRALRGPNQWCQQTVLEAVASFTQGEPGMQGNGAFGTRLRARFPDIDIPRKRGRNDADSLPHALAYAALALQAQAGCPVTFTRIGQTGQPHVYLIVVEYSEEAVGRLAFEQALALCEAAAQDLPFPLADVLDRLRELNVDTRLGPSTDAIVQAAIRRNIPYRRLTQSSLVQFGWGRLQRRIQAAATDKGSAIGEAIAQDKALTKALLAGAGVPVPEGRCAMSPEDAWAAAVEFGPPVVVKPRDGRQGQGVAVNIHGREDVFAAYALAKANGSGVIVERYIPGHDFRLLVVGDKVVAAARRDPPQVVGDGRHRISELVAQVNADPRRGEGHATSLSTIHLDALALATLATQGYTADSILEKGKLAILRNNANLSTGGTATDVTAHVHPDVTATAIAAAEMVGLDVCGIDLVADNVFEPLERQNGCIVEVNAAPGLRMHLSPSFGKGQDVGKAIIDLMFAPGENGRIPVVAVTGANGKTTTVRLIAHLLKAGGRCVGMTSSDGVYVGDRRIDSGDCSGPRSARSVLLHPDVDAAVLETARGGILREGLGFDRCDVAVVTNIGSGDHLGMDFVDTVEDLARVKRVVVDNLSPEGVAVLNAADPHVAAMAENCPGRVAFFARDGRHPVLAAHRAQGGRAVYVEDGAIIMMHGDVVERIGLEDVAIARHGAVAFQAENAMAGLAAVWALGLDASAIRTGLASFSGDTDSAPGRFNVLKYQGATLIADYGHNPDAISALAQAVSTMSATRRCVLISGAGDRRDADLRRQTEILGDVFDEVILYEDGSQRGRPDGEVNAILREGLAHARRVARVREVRGELAAIDAALEDVKPGELYLLLIDQVEAALQHIQRRIARGSAHEPISA